MMGTVRLFIAPTSDERGQPLGFEEQRRMMIELDKFTQNCKYDNIKIKAVVFRRFNNP